MTTQSLRSAAARIVLRVLLALPVLGAPPAVAVEASAHDPALAKSLGADERGMRPYVLVILKTGPTRVPAGPERDAMFKGHFADMARLSDEGVLVLAGPLAEYHGYYGSAALMAVRDIHAKLAQPAP